MEDDDCETKDKRTPDPLVIFLLGLITLLLFITGGAWIYKLLETHSLQCIIGWCIAVGVVIFSCFIVGFRVYRWLD